MTDRAQFEAMLEALINEDQETAKEIFHNIVVAKSREIYEELLESDFNEVGEPAQGEEEETMEAGGEEEEESAPEEEGEGEEEGGDDFGGDDEGGDEFGGEDEGEDLSDEEQTDRILDLEDALDELKAEFEQMMAGEHGGDDMGGDEFGGDDMGGDEFGSDDLDAELDEFDGMGQPEAPMMEYVNKVTPPKHGDNGANTKSIVAKKNDMGGTTANIAKSFSTTSGGTQGGLLKPSTTKQDAGNVNVPGGKSATKLSPVKGGHGAEKKGSGPGPVGSGSGDKAGQTSVGKVLSPINGAPNRAK